MSSRVLVTFGVLSMALVFLAPIAVAQQSGADIPRTPDGRPDLSGSYDTATLTPLQRPARYGDQLVLTEEEAAAIAAGANSYERIFNIPDERNEETGPPREAPPVGGDGSSGAAGNVGGYNSFWMDRGNAAFQIDGQWRTSIITDPPNGRQPPMTQEARAARAAFAGFFRPNTGTAWWLEDDLNAPGPYDNPETRPDSERCLLGFGSTSGPPMLPVLYNNLKRIVQTEDTVMIQIEMVHEARIVRMNQEHGPPRSGAGWGIRSVTGKVTRWWSTPRTFATPRRSVAPLATCMWWSGSRASTPTPSCITSRWTTRRSGRRPGAANTSGRRATTRCTNTPATRRITRSAGSFAAHACWRRTPARRDSAPTFSASISRALPSGGARFLVPAVKKAQRVLALAACQSSCHVSAPPSSASSAPSDRNSWTWARVRTWESLMRRKMWCGPSSRG